MVASGGNRGKRKRGGLAEVVGLVILVGSQAEPMVHGHRIMESTATASARTSQIRLTMNSQPNSVLVLLSFSWAKMIKDTLQD